MLTIRNEQLNAFKREAERRFVAQMMAHLREHFPAELLALGDPELRAQVEREVRAARGFGLTTARDLQRFLSLGALCGAGFIDRDENAWMRAYLSDPEVGEPGDRMHRLYAAFLRKLDIDANNRRVQAEFEQSLRGDE